MKICVMGLGYIGFPTALLLAQKNYVVGVDINEKKVKTINKGNIPIREAGIPELYEKVRENFIAKNDVEEADVFIIAVPTPLDDYNRIADLTYIKKATDMISKVLEKDNLVVLESTVPPTTSERIIIPRIEKSGIKIGEFLYAYCPERALPGKILYELVNNDRIIGGIDRKSAEKAKRIYSTFVKGKIFLTDVKTAEFVKLIENVYRDVNIAFANELAKIAEEYEINIWEAIELANKHPRVNILKPGPGVGGHCIPIDPWFLTERALNYKLITTSRDVNESMSNYVIKMIRELVKDIKNPVITIWGVTYKGNVSDTRRTPALKIIKLCEREGYEVRCFDPYAEEFEYELLSLENSVKNSDCIVIVADHKEFREIEPDEIARLMRNKNLVDTRNVVEHRKWRKKGFKVRILGVRRM